MRDRAAANLLRLARVRLDLRQADVSQRADISRTSVAEHELGRIEGATIRSLRSHAEAVGLTLGIVLRGPTGEVVKDEEHALLTQWTKRLLDARGWDTEAEASFSIYGERGRIDLLGWFAARHIVLIDEQKTDLPDVQDLLGTLDAKERLAKQIARERNWNSEAVAVLLVITRTSKNLRTVQRFSTLFDRFSLRGEAALRWLGDPTGPARMLIFVPPAAVGRQTWRNGRRRVRRGPPRSRRATANVDVIDAGRQSTGAGTSDVATSDIQRRKAP